MSNNKSAEQVVRKEYSAQFKDQALERIVTDEVPQVAKDLRLSESLYIHGKRSRRKVVIPLKIKIYSKQNFPG